MYRKSGLPLTLAMLVGLLFLTACASTDESSPLTIAGPTAPPEPVFRLNEVLGAAPATLDARLGAPALTRREGDGEYRRYSLSTCTLIVILYPDDAGVVRAAHVDAAALTSDDEKPNIEACLAAG